MEKRARIGTDPLSWIKDSKDESASEEQSTQSIHSIQSADDPRRKPRRVVTKTSQRGLPEGDVTAGQ